MTNLEQKQIDHWLNDAQYQIERVWRLNKEGFHAKHNISLQSVHTTVADDHASLGLSLFLNGESISGVRAELVRAARHVLKSFTMAYNETDVDYCGSTFDSSAVTEGEFIKGINYALMAGDCSVAKELANWFRDPPPKARFQEEINTYAHGLCEVVNGQLSEAEQRMVKQIESYEKKPSKKRDARANFHTMSVALHGIAKRDTALFNQGLGMQLAFYQSIAPREFGETPQAYICDDAVALANLGIHHGLAVTIEHDLLPKGLLIQS